MENLNAEQIKKALECCHSCNEADGKNCGYRQKAEGVEDLYISCTNVLIADALALIISQGQRIKELTEENERVKLEYAGFEAGAKHAVSFVKADTVRKMQERLIAEFRKDGRMNYYLRMTLDQIAKEMCLEGD